MLKTKPQPGTKIRCVDAGGLHSLTRNNVYEVQPDKYEVIANIKLLCNEETGEILSVELIKENK